LMSASCVYARFYSFSSSSRNYFFLFVVFFFVVVVRDYYTGESDEKAKTQNKIHPKQKNSCSSDNLPQNNRQLTEREFRRN